MTTSLKVNELRAELAKRGLSTTGTKITLVQRLESTISEESKKSTNAIVDGVHGKRRQVGSDNWDSNGKEKFRAIDKFRDMGVKQLREEAFLRGIQTHGSKKELLERLCACSNMDSKDVVDVNEEKVGDGEKKEKMVKATKKGSAVLDQWLPEQFKAQYHVLQLGDEIFDAMLNQTNVGENNNKFYVIQVLESDHGGRYMVYNRWGRVGYKGQDKLDGPCTSQEQAIQSFENKFYSKTYNYWSDRKEFVCHPKRYTWLEMDYSESKGEPAVQENFNSGLETQYRETQLDGRVASFISLICNISMMKQQMMEIGYNAEKLPLGKLSKATILKGYNVLKRISDAIGHSDRKTLSELTGEFYTVVPHDFGFKKMSAFVIDTPQKLKRKLEMVEALGEIEVATKLLEDDIGTQDPLYSHYQHLCCELTPLEIDSREFSMIAKYMRNTHAKTHSSYTVDIVQIFAVQREGEVERFEKFSSTKNRMLLWHGSRLTNWTGILSQGLRVAPPEAPVTGYMFGKGVYFADMFSKSANYCYASPSATAGVVLLCEVALGDMAELLTANYDADKLPDKKLSTKGVGATTPDYSDVHILEDGVIVPLGKPKEQAGHSGKLLYNEYIVYNVDQISMRYVVQVNFNFKR